MKSTSAIVYEELAIFTAVSASSSRLALPGAPGWTIGTADKLSVDISRPLNNVMRVAAEKVLER
jgi:hypothetical protein